jgi:hypothetical protein
MTERARMVLSDCVDAHTELVGGLQGSAWRRRWTTVVVLLRVVLHVLDKVDAAADPALRRALDQLWSDLVSTKPTPELLWRFIEEDRNLILKEYAHRAGQSATVFVGTGTSDTTYHMNAGPFEGRDPRAVAADRDGWLAQLLDDLDSTVDRDGVR